MISGSLTEIQKESRANWIELLYGQRGTFAEGSSKTIELLEAEIAAGGVDVLLGHLRLCGTIPEAYRHDSTEEKAYSKYTDAVLAEAFAWLGLNSLVLEGRADMADVEAVSDFPAYDLVADAKAFRLTRTAKNQKDFKIGALARWKYGKRFAVVVCPSYHLPSNASQIYLDASVNNVCILTYAHLAALVALGSSADIRGALASILDIPAELEPSKSALNYWSKLNTRLWDALGAHRAESLWIDERRAASEALEFLKAESRDHLALERSAVEGLTREEAVGRILERERIAAREFAVDNFRDDVLLSHGGY